MFLFGLEIQQILYVWQYVTALIYMLEIAVPILALASDCHLLATGLHNRSDSSFSDGGVLLCNL